MATNGGFLRSKHTKHIKNRYFMTKNKVGKGDFIIKYCQTCDMWADINANALEGRLFHKMRARLMGVAENYNNNVER